MLYIYARLMVNYSRNGGESAKEKRQKALSALIQTESIGTQGELVARLNQSGFSCTQVSVSRDIRELGLVKRGGRYISTTPSILPENVSNLSENISVFIRSVTIVGDNLIIIKTLPGTAHSVGLLVDNMSWSKVAGSVAGDDTVFLAILGGASGCIEVNARLNHLVQKGK